MNLSRWQPFQTGSLLRQMQDLQHEMNRVFERWGLAPGLFRTADETALPVNLWEDDEALYVETELPGLTLAELEVVVANGNELVIKAERKPPTTPQGVWHRQECFHGARGRTIALPHRVVEDRVEARLEHGVLTIKLPKHESAKPKKILVKSE